jgi:hypothetical protein
VPTNCAKKRAIGEKLVGQDGADGVRLLVRLEVEQVVRHGPPDAHGLVRLADVGGDDVLEGGIDSLRHVGVGDGGEVVVHGCLPASPQHLLQPGRRYGDEHLRRLAALVLEGVGVPTGVLVNVPAVATRRLSPIWKAISPSRT